MRSEQEIRREIVRLRAMADSLEWALSSDASTLAEITRRTPVTQRPPAPSATGMSQVEADVLSALINLGAGSRVKAEEAVRAASKQGCTDFEQLFRRALKLVRPARTA